METGQIAVIYVIGVVIAAVILGAVEDRSSDDWLGGWTLAGLWPLVVVALAVAIFIGGPFWLGRQLRNLIP